MSWLDPLLAPTAHDWRPSFHPLLPLRLPSLPPRPPAVAPPAAPPRPFVCPLPPPGSVASRPPFAVGHDAHAWSDHFAWLSTPNARGQRIFIQRWLPPAHSRPPSAAGDQHSSAAVSDSVPAPAAALKAWFGKPKPRPSAAPSNKGGTPKAVVHLVHGISAHGSVYAPLAKELVAAGYAVVAHDAHGHGRSDGFRGHATSVQHYVDDARLAVAEARRRLPASMERLPRILLGHSLGGAVAIHLASAPGAKPCDWAGVILTAPAVAVYPNPLLRLFAPIIATLAPLMPVQKLRFDRGRSRTRTNSKRGPSDGTNPPAKDPLVLRGPVRARLGYEVLKSCARIMRCAPTFRAPVFVAHSRGDRVTDAQGSIDFVSKIGSQDKSIKLYNGNIHDLLAARGRQHKSVVRDIIGWADQRVEQFSATCPVSGPRKRRR